MNKKDQGFEIHLPPKWRNVLNEKKELIQDVKKKVDALILKQKELEALNMWLTFHLYNNYTEISEKEMGSIMWKEKEGTTLEIMPVNFDQDEKDLFTTKEIDEMEERYEKEINAISLYEILKEEGIEEHKIQNIIEKLDNQIPYDYEEDDNDNTDYDSDDDMDDLIFPYTGD